MSKWLRGGFGTAGLVATLLSVSQALAAAPVQPAMPGVKPVAIEIPFASASAAAVTVVSSPGAWGGARTGSEPTLSDRVVAYQISATLDPVAHTVVGQEKLTWRNRSDRPINVIYLHMYLNAFEGNGTTFFTEKQRPGFEFRSGVEIGKGQWGHIDLRSISQSGQRARVSYVHPDGGADTDHTVMRVDLPAAVSPGGSTTLDIDFFDQLPRVIARTGYFGTFHLVGQWYPKIGVLELPGERGATEVRWNVHEFHLHSEFFADYGRFDVYLTVPRGYVVGATGEETEAAVEKGSAVMHHFVQDDVHEFAWTADNRTAQPLEGTYQGAGSPTVKIKVLYPPEYASNAAPALKATLDSLAYFSRTLGPYPYNTVTVVIPPYNAGEASGMEYPSFFTADHVKEVTPNTFSSAFLDFVTIHEFGHGYFYGILGSNEFEEPMLDEGVNTYWDIRMVEERHQDLYLTTTWLRRIGIEPHISGFQAERLAAGLNHPADGVGENSWNRLSTASYGTVYDRTATIMHDLQQRLGTAVMDTAMKAYYERWKFRHPSVADLREALAESSGQRAVIEAAFNQQVYAAAKIDDSIDGLESNEVLPEAGTQLVGGKWLEETQAQVDARIKQQRAEWKKTHANGDHQFGPFEYRTTVTLGRRGAAVPETVVVHFADGSSETVEWNDTRGWQRYSWVKPARGIYAELDPRQNNLLDANRLNNSRVTDDEVGASSPGTRPNFLQRTLTAVVGGPASRRLSADVEAILQSALTLLTTL
jgi:hypothetical protein